jgi:DNA-binding NarL/FixJ family response regulator
MIRVLLVDDHPPILDAVGRALADDPALELIGAARSASEAERLMAAEAPDVVVCDVQMGGEAEGLRLLERHGRSAPPRFLMLSAYDYPSLHRAAHERGAAGYLLKTAEVAEVVAAIRTVAAGGTCYSVRSLRAIRSAARRPSERELEVIRLVSAGASNEEIARDLVISLKTVESHLRRMFDRYAVMNRTELAVLALREGWIEDLA